MSLPRLHFSVAELRGVFECGFNADSRLRALIHFSGGCPTCREAVTKLAGEEPFFYDDLDAVTRALFRWLEVLRGETGSSPDMRPVHFYWKERLPHEPAAFSRVVLEEADLAARLDPDRGRRVLREALELTSDVRLLCLGAERWHDLRGLGMSYLASAVRGEDSSKLLSAAASHLVYGSHDPEIRMVHEVLKYVVESRSWFTFRPELYLAAAEEHLGQWPRFGAAHLAELRAYQGVDHGRRGQAEEARKHLTEALCHMPGPCVRTRYVALHNLAAASCRLDDPEGMELYLPGAEQLAADNGWTRYRADLLRLRAVLHRRHGELERAEETFLTSIEEYLGAGDRNGALRALVQMRSLYLVGDLGDRFPELQRRFVEIVRQRGKPFSWSDRHDVVEWARELGIPDFEETDFEETPS